MRDLWDWILEKIHNFWAFRNNLDFFRKNGDFLNLFFIFSKKEIFRKILLFVSKKTLFNGVSGKIEELEGSDFLCGIPRDLGNPNEH